MSDNEDLHKAFVVALGNYKPWHCHARWTSQGKVDPFPAILSMAFKLGVSNPQDMANQLQVPVSDVDKWSTSEVLPHKKVRIKAWSHLKQLTGISSKPA